MTGYPKKLGLDMKRKGNRLTAESSPYLLQHAQNPVDWYPWGAEAFERAKNENKPIFLSIGYSTCHWCHVMAHESFEDEGVAMLLNETFICIKVDREERPDIDGIYMEVCQAMTGGGGWPLTILMTPDKMPFYAATYIPRKNMYGRLGLLDLIPRINALWREKRHELERSAEQVVATLKDFLGNEQGDILRQADLDRTYRQLCASFDKEHFGFGSAPKFPASHMLLFLLRYWFRTGDKASLDMVELTLRAMRLGGIFDQVGLGFHRYSTDAEWFVPHFEKMLYDQAMLCMAYVEAYQATGKVEYADTAREVLTYVLRDMTSEEGGFYSAEDADSEGVEGQFYTWTVDELREVLGEQESKLIVDVYGVLKGGNLKSDAGSGGTGANVLRMQESLAETSRRLGISTEELKTRVDAWRRKLLDAREKRVRPRKDDKVLADWNGLMIAAMSKAAQALGDPSFAEAAEKAAGFIIRRMRADGWRLFHRYRDGQTALPANLDDYAFMAWGLLELYEATLDSRHLETALHLANVLNEHFWDEESGGFYFTADDAEQVLIRRKPSHDGAMPSGNSVALTVLLRLHHMTGDQGLAERVARSISALSASARRSPMGHTHLMTALDLALGPTKEVVIVGRLEDADTKEMLNSVRSRFLPRKVLLFRPADTVTPAITETAEFTRELRAIDGKATAYICSERTCSLPTTEVRSMLESLESNGRSAAG